MDNEKKIPLSPNEIRFMEDLEKAKRLSLECFNLEKGRPTGHNNNNNNNNKPNLDKRRSSEILPSRGGTKLQNLDLKSRPRPFSRGNPSSTSPSGSVIKPPSSSNNTTTTFNSIPPPVSFKRHNSLPHRHHKSIIQTPEGDGNEKESKDSPLSAPVTYLPNGVIKHITNNNQNNSGSTSSSTPFSPTSSDDLILLASPKVTPKFGQSGLFCDNSFITNFNNKDISASSNTSTPSSFSSTAYMNNSHGSMNFAFNSNNNSPALSASKFSNGNNINNISPITLNGGIRPNFAHFSFGSPITNNSSTISTNSPIIRGYLSPMTTPSIIKNPPPSSPPPIGFISPLSNNYNHNNKRNNNNNKVTNGNLSDSNAISNKTQVAKDFKPGVSSSSSTINSTRNSLYQDLTEELQSLSNQDDLIDFGFGSSQNILDSFDPLLIKERHMMQKEKEKENLTLRGETSSNQDKLDKYNRLSCPDNKSFNKISSSNTSNNTEREIAGQISKNNNNGNGTNDNNCNTASGSNSNGGNQNYRDSTYSYAESCISTATSAFSFSNNTANKVNDDNRTHSLSLYPSLDEFQINSIYSNVADGDKSDASSFYDVYNPFEYLYAVSCSSPSNSSTLYDVIEPGNQDTLNNNAEKDSRSIGFSHFFSNLPVPVLPPLPPALPPRNSDSSVTDNSTIFYPSLPKSSDFMGANNKEVPPSKMELRRKKQLLKDISKRGGKLYENIESIKHFATTDSEIQAFYEMLKELRLSCRHVDSSTNKGYIRSATLENGIIKEGLSIKLLIWNETCQNEPVVFTCDVSTPIELVIGQCIVEMELEASARDFIIRVKELNEYLDTQTLSDYRYIQECIKLDNDVHLILVNRSSLEKKTWARLPSDDASVLSISIDDILPQTQAKTITYSEISIPLEVLDKESERIRERLSSNYFSSSQNDSAALSTASLIQPVKAICVLLGHVETVEIVNSLNLFVKAADEWNKNAKNDPGRRTKIGSDCNSRLSYVEILPSNQNNVSNDNLRDYVLNAIYRVEDSVRTLVEMYSKSFPVSFKMKEKTEKNRTEQKDGLKQMSEMLDCFCVRLGGVHRLKPEWMSTYNEYVISANVYHGTRWLGKTKTVSSFSVSKSDNNLFFNTVVIDSWLSFHLPICILPRESRIVFTLFGIKPSEDNSNNVEVELGWSSMQLFNFKGYLAQGNYLLPLWQVGLIQKRLGPAPNSSFSSDGNAPLITIEFSDFGQDISFPEVPSALPLPRDFNTLDNSTQILLKEMVETSTFTRFPPEAIEILWEKRHYLHEYPNALPKVLLAAQLWDYASLAELHAMLQHWKPLDSIDALQLLLPFFPDGRVREEGIRWISNMPDEDLINLLPQLVEALSYETFDLSPLARFLLKKALSCLKISHYLFWLLLAQVGVGKWEKNFEELDQVISRRSPVESYDHIYDPKRRRLELMLNSLMVISGAKWKNALLSQFKLNEELAEIAMTLKNTKESARNAVLIKELDHLDKVLFKECSFPLPLSPAYDVSSINLKGCSYFNSAALPLKISFSNALPEGGIISAIYKAGDDLRQDMLTIQVIRLIEKWWLKEGLDLRVLTFNCIPTGNKKGLVEMINHAETLCRIQAEHGLTGPFRNRPIAEWLAKMNPSTLDYRRAIDNFTRSCAAYCVVTYVLGICDRHNDNIMLTKRGHLFHIDFGKFLGDAQMFGSFKRDRTPFVLTSDMVYVINDGEKSSHRFHKFVELCCQAFKIVRQNGNILLNLFVLMVTAGIAGVDFDSVSYIQKALLPESSNIDAAARFTRYIEESLQNWFTPVNFFLHSLAQMRFSTENTENLTGLSFVPNVYTMFMDGRIEKALIAAYQKKYDPEKYYLFTVKVKRKNQTEWCFLYRSYKEFLELYSKLCLNFPMAVGNLKALQRGAGLGRSNVKQVAEKRKFQLQQFLNSLFTLADEISHSDLVYTFFHPLLRDEEIHLDDEDMDKKASNRVSLAKNPSKIQGQIKLSIEYQKDSLLVLILHAVDLACPNNQPPSPYIKTYLQPDPQRKTKRKTRVVKKNQHPTFMDAITYRLPLEYVRTKTLQVSVWHHDPLQENNFLGGVIISLSTLPLDKETTETYSLTNVTSIALK